MAAFVGYLRPTGLVWRTLRDKLMPEKLHIGGFSLCCPNGIGHSNCVSTVASVTKNSLHLRHTTRIELLRISLVQLLHDIANFRQKTELGDRFSAQSCLLQKQGKDMK